MAVRELVLVTGAAGSVGIHLVHELLKQGYRIKATDLPGRRFPFGGSRVSISTGDLRDQQFVKTLPEGVDHVIHAGACVDIFEKWKRMKEVNVEGSLELWNAAVENGVSSFVFFSSAYIYRDQQRDLLETDPMEPYGAYEKSKFLAEKALLRGKFGGASTRLVILRPSLTIGPHGTSLLNSICTLPPLFKKLLGYAPLLYGGPKVSVIHSLDAARSAVHLMHHGEDGQAYNVATDNSLPMSELFNTTCRQYGVLVLPFPPVPLPSRKLAQAVAPAFSRPEPFQVLNTAAETAWNRLREVYHLEGDLKPQVGREILVYGFRDAVFDSSKLRATGFEFRFPEFSGAIRDVLDWFKREHWIPL